MCDPCNINFDCGQINWSDKYEDDYEHDDSKCNCCHSKMNRNEISYGQYISVCKMYKEKRKHIYLPRTWH